MAAGRLVKQICRGYNKALKKKKQEKEKLSTQEPFIGPIETDGSYSSRQWVNRLCRRLLSQSQEKGAHMLRAGSRK